MTSSLSSRSDLGESPHQPSAPDRAGLLAGGHRRGKRKALPYEYRRAVSSAYYGLFHAILLAAAEIAVPPTVGGRDERLLAPRWVHHADVAKVCGWVTRIASLPGGHATAPRGTGGDRVWPLFTIPSGPGQRASAVPLFVQDLAQSFVDLYLARQAADYDHLDRFDKSRAIALVDDAKQALDLLSNNRGDAYLERMLSLVVLRASRAS